MSMPSPYLQYQQNAVLGAAPEQLTLMLYNGALRFLKQALLAIDKKDAPGAHNAIVRVQAIIQYLRNTLKEGLDLSSSLDSLYDYLSRRLVEANLKKDPLILQEVTELIEGLKDAWNQAARQMKSGASLGYE